MIFVLMDTDDCTEQQKEAFINKDMFKDHWAYPYIQPIYNDPALEPVLAACGICFKKKGDKRKQEYVEIFPTDSKYIKSDTVQITELKESLADNIHTNMDVFLGFCLALKEKQTENMFIV